MKYTDINAKYTKVVADYIAAGYVINTGSMAGHQGEISKVDLVKDGKLVRISLLRSSKYTSDPNAWAGYTVIIHIGTWNHPAKDAEHFTVWYKDLEDISQTVFYEVGRQANWYVESEEEALKYQELRYARYNNRVRRSKTRKLSEDAKYIAREYLKRKHGYKRVSWNDIEVTRVESKSIGMNYYSINYRGTSYRLY